MSDQNDPILNDAVDYQPDALEIEARPAPWFARSTLYLLVAFILGFIVWANLAKVDRVVTAPGRLITTEPTIVLQPLTTSLITGMSVRPGERVEAGQVIVTLDPTFAQADQVAAASTVDTLEARIARLQAELEGTPMPDTAGPSWDNERAVKAQRELANEAQLRAFDERIARLTSEIRANDTAQQTLRSRLEIVEEQVEVWKTLYEKEVGSRLNYLRAEEERLNLSQSLDDLISQRRSLNFQLQETRAEKDTYTQNRRRDMRESLSDALARRDGASSESAKADRLSSLVELRSPISAVVLNVAELSVGSVAQAAEPLVTLTPAGVPLEVEGEVKAADISDIAVGDEVKVKLEAFPFQRFGALQGTIISIAPDATPKPPEAGGGYVYRIVIELADQRLETMPPSVTLSPGMTAVAEIKVDKRSVMSYLMYPLTRMLDESFREPN